MIIKAEEKKNPLCVSYEDFCLGIQKNPFSLEKALYSSLTGVSPLIANELCYRAGMDAQESVSALNESAKQHVFP